MASLKVHCTILCLNQNMQNSKLGKNSEKLFQVLTALVVTFSPLPKEISKKWTATFSVCFFVYFVSCGTILSWPVVLLDSLPLTFFPDGGRLSSMFSSHEEYLDRKAWREISWSGDSGYGQFTRDIKTCQRQPLCT